MCFALTLVCLTSSLWAADPVARLPRDQLLLFHQGTDVVPVKSVDDWQHRKAEILAGFASVAGSLPGDEKRCPFDVQVEEEVDAGSYVRRLITYASEPGCRTPAYVLIPKAVLNTPGAKAPAVLCLHPTDNNVGMGVVVGLGPRENRSYANELAERGYICFAPNYPLLAKYQPDIKALGWESGTLKAVWDNIRGLDWLSTQPYVDSTGFAAIGHSLGGHNSVYTAIHDDRIKVIVSSCGLDSYLDYYDGAEANWFPERGWVQTRYLPKLAAYRGHLADIPYDFHELMAALAPRHTLIVAPLHDSNFRAASVDRVVTAAKPVFQLFGHPERLQVEHPDCDHDFPPAMREQAYRLIDSVLKPKKKEGQ